MLLARLEQDLAGPEGKAEVCARHTERARKEPHDADLLYLSTRCMPDGPEQDERFLALQAEHPDHPWLAAAAAQTRAGRDELDAAISQLAFARSRLPAVAGDLALLEARVRRLRGPADASELAELEQVSPQLAALLALDRGDTEAFAERAESVASYPELDRGALAQAVTRSDPSSRARVVRLAAASDGANGSLVQAARNLAPEDGIDHSTVWTAIAFARAHRVDPAPYVEYARGPFGDDVDAMLAFAMREQLLADLDAASRSMQALPLELRGHAAVMGVITLGADAPALWRTVARGLLFASERPYFADPEAPPTSGSNGRRILKVPAEPPPGPA